MNSIGVNPYNKPKAIVAQFTECELCHRVIPTKNWGEHERSKKHNKAKDEERRAKDNLFSVDHFTSTAGPDGDDLSGAGDWGTGPPTGQDDGWGSAAAGNNDFGSGMQGGGGGGRACYGCGEEGHTKRDW